MASIEELRKRIKTTDTKSDKDEKKKNDPLESLRQRVDTSSYYSSMDKEINDFVNTSGSFLNDAKSRFEGMGYKNASSEFTSVTDTARSLKESADRIRNYINFNRGRIGEKQYNSLDSYLNEFERGRNNINGAFGAKLREISKYKNEEDYNFWQNQSTLEGRQKWYADSQKKLKDLNAELEKAPDFDWTDASQRQKYNDRQKEIKDEIDKIETNMRNYERGNYSEEGRYYGSKVVDDYFGYSQKPDFGKVSANRNYDNPTMDELTMYDSMNDSSTWYYDENSVLRDAYGNKIEKDASGRLVNPNAQEYAVADRLGIFLSASEKDRAEYMGTIVSGTWGNIIGDGIDGSWDQLTKDEIDIYYYLLNNSGKETADKYLSDMKTELNRRETTATNQEYAKIFDEAGLLEKIGLNIATVPAQLVGGIAGTAENIAYTLRGQDINPYSSAHAGSHFSNTIRSETAEDFNEKNGGYIWGLTDLTGFTAGDVYQAGMSILDSYAAIGIGGSFGGVLLATSAASSEASRLYEQGASTAQIALGSAAAGAAEMVFESLSIDKLINIKDATTVGQIIKNALIQGGIEASEEGFTEIANILTNSIIMGNESDWAKLVEEYNGDKWQAFLSKVKDVANASISGFLSGVGSASIPSVASYGKQQAQYSEAGGKIMEAEGGLDALKALALNVSGADSKLAKQANKVTGETYTGEGLIGKAVAAAKTNKSQKAVGKLHNAVQTEVTAQNKADIAKSLEEGGFSQKSAKNIADAIVARANGEELSKFQKATLESVKGNKKVDEIADKLFNDMDSSVNKRDINLLKYNLGISHGVGIGPNTSRTNPAQAGKEITSSEGNLTANTKTVSEGNYEVAEDGKTTIAGQEVTLDGFKKTDDGTIVVATKDNQTAAPGDVTYSSKGQALVYENYANIETVYAKTPAIANMDLGSRSALAKLYDPAAGVDAKDFFLGANYAWWHGFRGIPMTEKTLSENSLVKNITKEQRDFAYELGKKAGEAAAVTQGVGIEAAYEKAVEKLGGKEAAKAVAKRNKGEVILGDNIKLSSMTNQQKGSYRMAKIVAEATGLNIRVYHGVKEYGKYDTATGEILLNINAMFSGQSMMAFTLGHELVHLAKQWSPHEFKEFADYLLEQYGKKGVSVESLILEQMANAKNNGYELNEDEAYEEVIADACQRMLLDSDAVQKMAAFKAQNPTRWQQIIDAIKEFIDKIRQLFIGAEPDSTEAALYKEFDAAVKEHLENKFVEMVMDAGEHMSTIRNAFGKGTVVEVNENGEFTLAKGEDSNGATKFLYNDYTWEKGGRDTLKAALKAEGFSQEDIDAALTIMDGKHKLVKDLAKEFPEQDRINQVTITTDLKDGHSVLSALVSNGDYPVNIDLLMVCKKRKAYQRVINRLCETGLIQQATVDALAIAEINKILGKYGFETACLGCFVESRRLRIQEWAETICKEWNAEVKKRNPNAKAFGFGKGEATLTADEVMQLVGELESGGEKNDKGNLNLGQGSAVKRMGVLLDKVPSLRKTLSIEDLITPDGLSSLRRFDSNLFSMVKSRYGSNSPKFVQEFNPYNHELAKYGKVPTEYKSLREYLYAIGGARMQSFSDFIVENWFDYCQIVADLATRKLPMHTYTKEIALAKLFGLTGIKINMSLIPDIDRSLGKEYAGLTRNANGELELIWADKDRFKTTGGKSYMQSINFADAIALQEDPRYSANVGTIAVGVSDNHILMMLDDPRIRMVIPYHSSGMNPIFADLMGTSYYKDYTMFQNTTVKQLYNSKGQKVSLKLDKTQTGKLTSGFQFNEVLQDLGDARAAAQAYKDWCADASKHTITIKGETYTAELTPKFDDFSGHDNYYKLLEDFNTYDCISEQAAPQGDVQQNYPEDFDNILKAELTSQEGHRQKQVANQAFDKAMGEIETYLKSHTKADTVFYAEQHGVKLGANDKKLGAEDKKKLAELRKGVKNSMPKVDSQGNQLSVGQQEFFKHSVVRDAEGKLMIMYHGTANGGAFTVFEGDKLGNNSRTSQIGQGFYFTNVKQEAAAYTKNVDIYGRTSKGRNPHLHQVYLNIINPFNVGSDTLDIDKVKSVYMDGTYDYFFRNWIPFTLHKKTVDGRTFTEAEVQAMSKADKVSAYVDYLSQLGTKEVLSNMVRAFPYGKQSELLASMKNRLGYDGIVEEFKPGQFQYVAFSPEQVKSVENQSPTSDPDIRYSMPKSNSPYSYEALVSKPDMMVTTVGENVPKNRADLVHMAKQNAAMVGKIDPKSGSVSVYVKDIGRDVGIGRDGLKHSLDGGRMSVNAPILVKVGEIISNSIRINELTPREDRIDESYVLIGAAINADNDLYIVRSVVNRFTHKLVSLDVLYAINAKKEPAALLPLSAGNPALGTDSTISIAKLLDYVNQYFPDVLPEEVLKHYGHDSRPEGKLGEDALYKNPNTHGMSSRQLLADAFDELVQTPKERELMDQYRANINKVEDVQNRLQKVRGKIRELTKVNGDKTKIATLNKTAAELADLIDRYDRNLLEMEASKPLRDVLSRAKSAAYKEAKQRGEKTMKEYRQQVSERFDRGVEGRRKTEVRHKIQNVVKELNDLLLNESKKRHVPDNLKKAVAGALSIVNMDTVDAEERAAKYAALIAKEQAKANPDQDKIDSYTITMENILRQGEKMGQRLKELRDAYEEIQDSDDPDIANAYDPVIAGAMKELTQTIGNTSIRNMTLDQLSDVYDMYRMVLTRVRDANKTMLENIKESIGNLASRVIGEVRMAGGEHTYRAAILDPARKFLWNNLKPVYAMEYIGSSTLTKVFNNVRAGEDTWAKDVTEAREFYLDKSKKYGYDSWDFKKKYRFKSDSGIEFELTLEQILSLYAYSKREQAHDHLRLGGFVFDSNIETYKEDGSKVLKYKVNTAEAHQITPKILADITGKLTKEQMGFVDDMQEYLSTVMGAKGNEVTSKMYGVKLFKEKFYFPLKSAKQFMFEQNEVSGEVKIKNSGFTNKVVAKANNPVILSNFMDVWSGHVNDMSMYHAFTLPLEDFNRVFNYNSPKMEGQPPVSVKGTIQSAYSPAAVSYVKNLITDLNGGARTDPTAGFINKMMGLFKKGSVFASLSVVVQQPSAIARAAALVDTKYFIGPKVDHKRHKALWDEVKQYAPVAIIKEMGYFDTNMGKSTQDFIQGKEYDGLKEKMKALVVDSDYRDEILSKAPALADEVAWCSIWEAVKREMHDKYPGLDTKAEPFLMLCGSRFTEVITKTQVYDSVLSRSGNMRSKDTGMKMATSFMAEPTTSINMIADALLQGKRGNRKYARTAIGAVIASQIFNSILVSFVYAGRDDDEDETYWEKYIGTLTGEVLDSLNPAGYIPFIKDIMSIVQGYDVERSDMAVISDLWKAIENLSNDKVSAYRKVEGFAGSIAQIFGLPVKNIMRDARGIYQTVMSFMNGQQTTRAGIGTAVKGAITGKTVSDNQQLYDAILSGDQTQITRVKGRYKDTDAVNSAIRKALRENDPRIHEAAIAWNANDLDEYMRIAKAIIAEKHFVQDDVVMAIRAEANALKPDEETSSTSKAKGLFTAEKFAEAIAQGDQATANAIKLDLIQTGQKNGKTEEKAEESFVSSAKSELRELFLDGTLSESKAIDALINFCGDTQEDAEERVAEWNFETEYGFKYDEKKEKFMSGEISASELKEFFMTVESKNEDKANANIVSYTRDAYEEGFFDRSKAATIMVTYGGLTDSEAESKLQYIDVKKQFPDTYVDDAWVAEYYKEVASAGISMEVFIDYRNQVKGITGEDKKAGRMAVINSMPISNAQKDALYYAEGWAASKLWQAPWH